MAARLNWPCVRVNLDGHISRLDLVGKDTIVLEEGKQITRFQEGIVPWALRRPVALIFDESRRRPPGRDVRHSAHSGAGRQVHPARSEPGDHPNPHFRLFATANTVGLGNVTGLYHGTQQINQAQMDRWNIVAKLDYLPREDEISIIQGKVPRYNDARGFELISCMVAVAELTRAGFAAGDLSTLMSPRTLIAWAENTEIFGDAALAFRLSFLNKCDEAERPLVAEYYQRCFDQELVEPQALQLTAI
ncbi:cobaltochelatase subunit CobS [Oceanimonas sp. NS1]|nr:cobaltochelatase subunit CobS [Oceanimonas sp. NS1]